MTYTLTKLDIAALRQADNLSVSWNRGETRVEAIKRAPEPSERCPYPQEARHSLAIPIKVGGYGFHGSLSTHLTADEQARVQAFGYVYLYPEQRCEASTIVAMLKAGDEVALEFVADCNSGAIDAAGWRVDRLLLNVDRGKARFVFMLDDFIGPDNSARMVRNLPPRPFKIAA